MNFELGDVNIQRIVLVYSLKNRVFASAEE